MATEAPKYIGVEVSRFDGEIAYCQAEYPKGRRLPVQLNRKSLEDNDLGPGDSFQWIPNREGVVRAEDITEHPRKFAPGEAERICKEAEQLRRQMKN